VLPVRLFYRVVPRCLSYTSVSFRARFPITSRGTAKTYSLKGQRRHQVIKLSVLVVTAFALVASVAASPPAASGSVIFNDPRIDQIASDAAGVHLRVDCYNNFDVWRHDWDQDENRTFFGAPSGARGQFFIMLSPSVCFTLVAALDKGPAVAGSHWSGLALLTLSSRTASMRLGSVTMYGDR
jgi:hypothetical protein